MKKLNISRIKKELEKLNANPTVTELVVNNALMYNCLLEKFINNEKVNNYLIYQLNVQITKQMLELKRLNQKEDVVKIDNPIGNFIEKKYETR